MKLLTEWAVCQNLYAAPEIRTAVMIGTLECGKKIRTSRIVEILSGDTVRTESGTVYRIVGAPHPENEKNGGGDAIEQVRKCLTLQSQGLRDTPPSNP